MKLSPGDRHLMVGFALVLMLVGALVYVTWHNAAVWRTTGQHLLQSDRLLARVDRTLVSAIELETGMHGFLLTGDERFLEPYEAARTELPQAVTALDNLSLHLAEQKHLAVQLRTTIAQQLDYSARMVADAQRLGREAVLRNVDLGQGKQGMDDVRRILADMRGAELADLESHRLDGRVADRRIRLAQFALAVLLLLAVVAAFAISSMLLRERAKVAQRLYAANSRLESRVEERTAELNTIVHELRDRERALEASESLRRLAMEAARMASFEWNLDDGRISGPVAEKMFHGLASGGTLTAEAFERAVHADDLPLLQQIARTTSSGEPFRIDFRVAWPDGDTRWIACAGCVDAESASRPRCLRGVMMDVSVQHAQQAEITALSHRLLASQEEERRHLARELHDDLGQALTTLRFELLAFDRRITVPSLHEALRESLLTLDRALAQLRGVLVDLRPPLLDELGIEAALRWLVQRQPLEVELRFVPEQPHLPAEIALACYRIAQEALSNVLRHAGTGRASLGLHCDEHKVSVEIRDAGTGFDPTTKIDSTRLGIAGMRERAQLAGGSLQLVSAPGTGCRVRFEAPLGGRV